MTGNQFKAGQTRLTAAALQGQYASGTIDLVPTGDAGAPTQYVWRRVACRDAS
jgi:hypothetical protein